MQGKTDVFLTHDWGKDELGRGNHERVAVVNTALKELGYTTWFDSDRMTGDIMQQMAAGIDNTKVVLVFVTQRYAQKVGGTNEADNCKLEFQYATRMKTKALMVPIIMEDRMKRPSEWTGPVGFALGGELALRMSFDFDDKEKFTASLAELKHEIDVRLKKLDAKIPDKPATSVSTPVSSTATTTESKTTSSTASSTSNLAAVYYALLHGAGDGVKIKKVGNGPGKFLYIKKNNKLDLTDDKSKANNWYVKPKRQYGKLGFSIVLDKPLDWQESSPSLILKEDSTNLTLNAGGYEEDERDFWSLIPQSDMKPEDTPKFRIVNMRNNIPVVAERSKAGGYMFQCKQKGVASLWEFESSTLLKAFPGQEEFAKVYDKVLINEAPVYITSVSHRSKGLSFDADSGKVSLSNASKWRVFPWKENGKSCTMITTDLVGKSQLAADGETVTVSKTDPGDVEFQDNKWKLIPVETRDNNGVYVIKKCMGKNAGAKLAVKEHTGKIYLSDKSKSDDFCKWILNICAY